MEDKPASSRNPITEFPSTTPKPKVSRASSLREDPNKALHKKPMTPKIAVKKQPNLAKAADAPKHSTTYMEPVAQEFIRPSLSAIKPSPRSTRGNITVPLPAQLVQEAPKRVSKKTYKAEDIAPTAVQMGIDPLNPAHPLTVPFLNTSESQTAQVRKGLNEVIAMQIEDEGDVYHSQLEIQKSAYGKKIVKTDIAENLFRQANGQYFGEGELFFVQLPTLLPGRSQDKSMQVEAQPPQPPQQLHPAMQKRTWEDQFGSTINDIPAGRIGKIYVLKSGKVKMKIGDVFYDVSEGMPCGFLQELVALDMESKNMHNLGDINKRMVVSLDVDALLKGQ